jgi:hypothetical protein
MMKYDHNLIVMSSLSVKEVSYCHPTLTECFIPVGDRMTRYGSLRTWKNDENSCRKEWLVGRMFYADYDELLVPLWSLIDSEESCPAL